MESLTLHAHFEHFFFLSADSLLAASPQEAYIIKCNLSSVWWILGYFKKKCWKKQTCCWTPCPESISQPNVPDNCWSPASLSTYMLECRYFLYLVPLPSDSPFSATPCSPEWPICPHLVREWAHPNQPQLEHWNVHLIPFFPSSTAYLAT